MDSLDSLQSPGQTCCCAHHSSGVWIDNVTPSPNLLSVSPSHSLPARRVCPELLLSVELCPYLLSASISPSLRAGRTEPRDWQLCTILSSASPSGSSLITGNTSQDLPLLPAINCTSPQRMLWYGARRERQRLSGRPQRPILQPLAFPQPQLRVLGGMTASAQPAGLSRVHG